MKTRIIVVLVMAAMLSAIAPAKESQSIIVSVQTDKPILQADRLSGEGKERTCAGQCGDCHRQVRLNVIRPQD
jgi:cytochrome c553